MSAYEIYYLMDVEDGDYSYGYADTHGECERFDGTWQELQDYIKVLKRNGAYMIDANHLFDYEEDDYDN